MKQLSKTIRLATLGLILPLISLAQLTPPNNNYGLPGSQGTTVSFQVGAYIQLFLTVVGLIAVAFLIYGGFRYITSAGNEEAAEGAKKIIQNSIIGLVVIILSYVIVVVVINALARNQV